MTLTQRYLGNASAIVVGVICICTAVVGQNRLPRPHTVSIGPLHDNPILRHDWFLSGRSTPSEPAASLLFHAYQQKIRNRTSHPTMGPQMGVVPVPALLSAPYG